MKPNIQDEIFIKPIWEPHNDHANLWIDYIIKNTTLTGKHKERIAVAAFLKVAPASFHSEAQKPLAAPNGNNYWSKFPLVGRKIMKRTITALEEKGFIHQLAQTGQRVFSVNENDKRVFDDIAALYEVDQKLLSYFDYKFAEFIETGRRLVSVGKLESYPQRRTREKQNKIKPKLTDTEANKLFRPTIFKLRDEVEELNKFWQEHPICITNADGHKSYGASAERVFHNGSIEKGGRFYGLWTPSKEQRKKATIDGEPIVQIDLNAAQVTLFSSLMGMKIKDTGRANGAWYDLYGEMACASSDNLEHLIGFRFGGSGSSLIEFMRFQFGGASAA